MRVPRWVEWIRELMREDKVTQARLSVAADVSESTLTRMFQKSFAGDINRDTANRIEAVFFGTESKYPCALAAAEQSAAIALELEAKSAELVRVQSELEGVRQASMSDQERLRRVYQERIAHLLKEEEHLCAEVEHLHNEVAHLYRTLERYEKLLDEKGK
jgi:transcriptional regulator with XRE-family HTH domain